MSEQNKTMSELFEDYGVSKIRTGDLIKGTVISVTPDAISVNLNYKSDGIITRDDYSHEFVEDLTKVINEGDSISAHVVKLGDQDGNVVLTRKSIEEIKIWEDLEKLKEENTIVEVVITEAAEFGISGKVCGIKGFVPKNQISVDRNIETSDYVGKTLKLQVLDTVNKKGRRQLILTGREIDRLEKEKRELEAWKTIAEGEIYEGVVKNIQSYGAFVDINGVDGLLHINEISWNRIKHPADVLHEGDKISVLIKSIDVENKKLSLSYKATVKSPWETFSEKNNVGDIVDGKVIRLADFGAFVEVDGIDCLLHIKDLAWERTEKVTDIVKVGDSVKAKILSIGKKDKRVGLGLKQLTEHPFDVFTKDLNPKDIIKVKVKKISLDGVSVEIDEEHEVFIPIRFLSKEKLRTPSQVCKIGDVVDAKIKNLDRKNKRIDLTFVIEEETEDEFSNSNGPVSYSTHEEGQQEFTIGDQFKNLEGLLDSEE